jgi:hypothetical protein
MRAAEAAVGDLEAAREGKEQVAVQVYMLLVLDVRLLFAVLILHIGRTHFGHL